MMSLAALILLSLTQAGSDSAHRARELIEELRSDNVEVRDRAWRRLKELGPGVLPELEKAALDPDSEVAQRVRLLLQLHQVRLKLSPSTLALFPDAADRIVSPVDRGCTEIFLKVGSDDRASREELAFLAPRAILGAVTQTDLCGVLHVVVKFRLREASPQVVGLLSHPEAYVAGQVVDALEKLRPVDQIPAIVLAARHESAATREYAATLLGRLGSDAETPVLVALLKDPQRQVRSAAGEALVDLEAKDRVSDLVGLLDFPASVHEALRLLGRLGAPEALPSIRRLLREGGKRERGSAADALGVLGLREAIPDLLAALKDEEPEVQASAARSLADLE